MASTPGRRPRDAQRRRVYLAETPLPSSPLPGLDACARFADRVVGTLWWHERFPERDPRQRAPAPARATARVRPSTARRTPDPRSPFPAGTAPRASCCTSSRTGRSASIPASLTTAAPSPACCSTRSESSAVPSTPRSSPRRTRSTACTSRVHRDAVPTAVSTTAGTNACASNKGATGLVRINWNTDGDEHELHGCFDGYERGSSVLRCRAADGELVRIPTKSVWAVRDVG